MECETKTNKSRDILASPPLALALFWIPAIAIVVTGSSNFRDGWRTLVWTAALITMGTACITNAYRCRRVHCYITGPFFILMAVVTLLYGLGVTPLGRNGWNLIGLTILFGAICLCCLPELFFGKYVKKRARERNRH
jgi:uncharacterized membrane protein HdeD (DUF308 family)